MTALTAPRSEDVSPAATTTRGAGSIYADWARALTDDPAPDDARIRAQADAAREKVERLRDPFTPIARALEAGDAVSENEKVLFHDDDFMVISDTFFSGAKVLVVPKAPCLFPSELDDARRARMETITAACREGFATILGKKAEDIRAWVNPPRALSVRQMHVHVQPSALDKAHEDELATMLPRLLASSEVEFKLAVKSSTELNKLQLAASGRALGTERQTNIFFDTETRALDNAWCIARLRRTDDTCWLTLKGVEKTDGALSKKAESEWVIDEAVACDLEDGRDPLELATSLAGDGDLWLVTHLVALSEGLALGPIGQFDNVRTKIETELGGHNVILEFDKTTFPAANSASNLRSRWKSTSPARSRAR